MQIPREQKDRCKNITLPQTSFVGGNKICLTVADLVVLPCSYSGTDVMIIPVFVICSITSITLQNIHVYLGISLYNFLVLLSLYVFILV